MNLLARLPVIRAAVFAADVAAKKTSLTPVLFFLFMGSVLVDVRIPSEESNLSSANSLSRASFSSCLRWLR
jgi:hypothetical protein